MTTRQTSSSRGDPRYDLEAYEQARLEAASQPSPGSSSSSGIFARSGWNDTELNSLQSLRRTRLAMHAEDDSVRSGSSFVCSVFYDPRSYSSWAQSHIDRVAPPATTGTESLAGQDGGLHSQSAPWSTRDRAIGPSCGLDNAPSERPSQRGRSHHRPNRSGGAQPSTSDGAISSRDSQLRATREQEAASSRQSPPVEGLRSRGEIERHRSSTSAGDISSSSARRAASARPPSKVRALISGEMVPAQNGHTCKPTALAALDIYFSRKHGVRNIPLRKSLVSRSEESSGDQLISVRQIAKANGSAQGEILQADRFTHVAEQMGYEARPHNPTDINDFRETIINNLSNGRPLVTFFPVNRETSLPSSRFDGHNEHAALIVGYDQKRDTVDLSHFQSLFKYVPMKKLYKSMQKLPSTREQEIYQRTGDKVSNRVPSKYSLVHAAGDSNANLLYSIVPEHGSGFKNTLFILNPDPAHDRWRGSRSRG